MLEVRDLHAGYGRIEVLRGLSFRVPAGSVVALLGSNGVGKTTTLRAISGALPVTSGSIHFEGRRIDGRRPDEIARDGLVLVPEGRGVFPGLTVEENLRLVHGAMGRDRSWADFADEVFGVFPRLGERRAQLAGSMSGGEQQMLAVCRAMAASPKLVLFDELSMGLAPLIVENLFEHVRAMRARGTTVVLVEQFLTHALALADVCYVLSRGVVSWAGEPAELRAGTAAVDYLTA
ncbi:MAG TPA: ABC transporter ATP-binding protein [Acidimicrobiales bacterium]|nr:ABC transporter ATP-binding protein [Acidimicrobiales bacterium]